MILFFNVTSHNSIIAEMHLYELFFRNDIPIASVYMTLLPETLYTQRRKWWNLRSRYGLLSWHYHRRPIFPGSYARGRPSWEGDEREIYETKSRFISVTLDLDRESSVRSCRGDISRFLFASTISKIRILFCPRLVCFSVRHNLLTIVFSF